MSETLLGVIIGGVLVGVSTFGAEVLRRRGESSLDRQRRKDDRILSLDNFQRESLIGIQVAAADTVRRINAVFTYFADESSHGAEWGASDLPPELNAADQDARLALVTFQSRVADATVRRLAEQLTKASYASVMAEDKAAANEELQRAQAIANRLLARSGKDIQATFHSKSAD